MGEMIPVFLVDPLAGAPGFLEVVYQSRERDGYFIQEDRRSGEDPACVPAIVRSDTSILPLVGSSPRFDGAAYAFRCSNSRVYLVNRRGLLMLVAREIGWIVSRPFLLYVVADILDDFALCKIARAHIKSSTRDVVFDDEGLLDYYVKGGEDQYFNSTFYFLENVSGSIERYRRFCDAYSISEPVGVPIHLGAPMRFDRYDELNAEKSAEDLPAPAEAAEIREMPLSIGVETFGGAFHRVISRGQSLPCRARLPFRSCEFNPAGVAVRLFLGEREFVKDNIPIGRLVANNLPVEDDGVNIDLEISADSNGKIDVKLIIPGRKGISRNYSFADLLVTLHVDKVLGAARANKAEDLRRLEELEAALGVKENAPRGNLSAILLSAGLRKEAG